VVIHKMTEKVSLCTNQYK